MVRVHSPSSLPMRGKIDLHVVILKLHFFNTTLTLHEHSLSATPKSTSPDPTIQLQRIESLWNCLNAVKSWFETFFCLEKSFALSYVHYSMAMVTQMGHNLMALFRLSTLEAPDIAWDCQRLRRELDLGEIVKRIIDSWEQVPQAVGIDMKSIRESQSGDAQARNRPCYYAIRVLYVVRSCWETKVAAMAAADAEHNGASGVGNDGIMNEFGTSGLQQADTWDFGAMNMDMLDDAWMRDILGGYDFLV